MEENMSKEGTSREYGPFGEVLAEIMKTRGLTPDTEAVSNLAICAGLDPLDLEREMYALPRENGGLNALAGDTHALTWMLSLTEPERSVLSLAVAFRKGSAEDVREARRSPEHKAERNARRRAHFPNSYPRPLVRYYDLEYEVTPCWVGHSTAVKRCPNNATMRVYDVGLCAAHGEERAAGAREELTQDAANALERIPHGDNIALRRACVKAGLGLAEHAHLAAESADKLLRLAYTEPPLNNDFEIPHYYALRHDEPELEIGEPWVYSLRRTRRNIHALMRRAYQMGEDDVVDHLEDERQSTAVFLSYALAVEDGAYPEHVEKVRAD
jgi:hypothetical protein